MVTEELLTYIFDGASHSLAPSMTTWLTASRRYTEFVTTFRDKIRKKLRTTPDPENLLDLRLELETAYLLLQERRLTVAYEPLPPRATRSPDFGVTYTTSLTFMVEVTRLRAATLIDATSQPHIPPADERLVDTICGKLGQLLAGQSNVLLIGVETDVLSAVDLDATMRYLQQRAEQNDPAFFQRTHFRARADFFRQYQRLSEILVRATQEVAGPPLVWVNAQAKQPLPSKVRTALYRSHTI
ncbi:MAG: hypothetical protein KDE53_13230 [Caldilineaceae bacterium]|nr:hypothetical protein [Caldilineaceae bacterium]MCB0185179.1 hypothetical protein [Caldilineaceae bacterium]